MDYTQLYSELDKIEREYEDKEKRLRKLTFEMNLTKKLLTLSNEKNDNSAEENRQQQILLQNFREKDSINSSFREKCSTLQSELNVMSERHHCLLKEKEEVEEKRVEEIRNLEEEIEQLREEMIVRSEEQNSMEKSLRSEIERLKEEKELLSKNCRQIEMEKEEKIRNEKKRFEEKEREVREMRQRFSIAEQKHREILQKAQRKFEEELLQATMLASQEGDQSLVESYRKQLFAQKQQHDREVGEYKNKIQQLQQFVKRKPKK